jgi:hypothetical protein
MACMTGLRAGGAYDLLASIVVLDHRYRPGDEESVVGMVHRPLEVGLARSPPGRRERLRPCRRAALPPLR